VRGISLSALWRASAAAIVTLGCGGSSSVSGGPAPADDTNVLPPRALSEVFVLEAAGAITDDTAFSVASGAGRVIVLRRPGPDYGLFARLIIPPGDSATPRGPLEITLRPRPGLFALDVLVQGTLGEGARIEFSYGMHFVAPAGARERYGGDLEFERALRLARLEDSARVVFLPTRRPGSDMVSAPLTVPGRYLVAAPR
jgi:hypothetical protein